MSLRVIDKVTSSGYIEVKSGKFKINNNTIANPSGIEYEEHTLSRAWNDASGIQHKINYRLRRKFMIKYDVIGKESLNDIYDILNGQRIETGSTRFNVEIPYITGQLTTVVEWGTPFKVECIDNKLDLYTLEISLIEPIGVALPHNEN